MIYTQDAPASATTASHDEVALLRGMIEIDSLSGHEGRLANFIVEQMARRGMAAHLDAEGNAVGQIGDSGPLVMLLGHMDTAPGHVRVRTLVRQEGDLLYGRGAVDAKGPLAAFICAAARLRARYAGAGGARHAGAGGARYAGAGGARHAGAAGTSAGIRLVVAGAVEEESATARGARCIAASYRPDYCVIGEPSRWDRLTLGYKGRLLVHYSSHQPSAHSAGGAPTAAERAVTFWNDVKAVTARQGGEREFNRLSPTLRRIDASNDGLTDAAAMTLSLRLPPACDSDELRRALSQLAPDASVTFAGDELAYVAPKNTPLVRAFLSAIRRHGATPAFALKTGTSDMNVVAPVWQCPILAYGPGDSSLDHTPNEHINLAEYGRAIDVLHHALARLGGDTTVSGL